MLQISIYVPKIWGTQMALGYHEWYMPTIIANITENITYLTYFETFDEVAELTSLIKYTLLVVYLHSNTYPEVS